MKTLLTFALGIIFCISLSSNTHAGDFKKNDECCKLKPLNTMEMDLEEAIQEVKQEWINYENGTFFKVIHITSSQTNGHMKMIIETEEQYLSDEIQSLLKKAELITESQYEAYYLLD
jgi:hypothetical protein